MFFAIVATLVVACDRPASQVADDLTESAAAIESESEMAMLATQIELNGATLRAALEGLTDEELAFKESEDRWSIGEVAEHIVMSEVAFQGFLETALTAYAAPETRTDSTATDEMVVGVMADRTAKYEAPDTAQPTGEFKTAAEAIEAFDAARAKTLEILEANGDKNLRDHFVAHPAMGPLDAHQWFLFAVGHCARHTEQIDQVKAHQNYPSA